MRKLLLAILLICFLVGSGNALHAPVMMVATDGDGISYTFNETWENCTSSVEPDANCDEGWTPGGTDIFVVTDNAGSSGSDKGLIYGGVTDVACTSDPIGQLSGDTIELEFKVTNLNTAEKVRIVIEDNNGFNITNTYIEGIGSDEIKVAHGAITVATGMDEGVWHKITYDDFDFTGHTVDIDVSILGGASQGSLNDTSMESGSASNIDSIDYNGTTDTISITYDDVRISP